MRVFLDANILFFAAKSDGAVRALLSLVVAQGHELVADDYVVAEARRNLLSKGAESVGALDTLLRRIQVAPYRPAQLPADLVALIAVKDRPVMAAAIRLRCDALVSGDSTHFGRLYGTIRHGVAVHSPRSLAVTLKG